MVGAIRLSRGVGRVQGNQSLGPFPGTIFVCLLPFLAFRGTRRVAGVDLADTLRFVFSDALNVSKSMTRASKILVVAALSVAVVASVANAQQADTGSGGGRKHHQKKTDTAAPTASKADEKAYNAALKSLPNKPFDPWSGTR
jgi:hypothetical protein